MTKLDAYKAMKYYFESLTYDELQKALKRRTIQKNEAQLSIDMIQTILVEKEKKYKFNFQFSTAAPTADVFLGEK